LVTWVLNEVREKGPLTAGEIDEDVPRRTDNWGWNWSDTKRALEWLFWRGDVTVAERNGSFARRYDLPERVLPATVVNAPTPPVADAMRELVRIAASSLGVAAEVELRDYFRLPVAQARTAIAELVDQGVLLPVSIQGWRQRAYLHRDARMPRRIPAATLVSPFDPLVWERSRALRLFGFHYRIEIYTPATLRVYGYYVLPFLLGDHIVARVDLKADRKEGALLVPGAWVEPDHEPSAVAEALASALEELAVWLGLDRVVAPQRGDLAPALSACLGSPVRVTV
jgi:uncharacterized protein